MIMFGGIGDKETPADRKVHQYDIAIHTWKILRKDDPPIIPERSEHVALYNNGTMYIVGGKTSPSDQCDVWMFPICLSAHDSFFLILFFLFYLHSLLLN